MKIRIHPLTWFIWLIALLNNSYKPMSFLFLMMMLHEGAHCLIAVCFKVKVYEVQVLPFGLCAKMRHLEFYGFWSQICISIAGPLMHLLIGRGLLVLTEMHILSSSFGAWCHMMNNQILFFNLLPIYPLDGYKITAALGYCVLPYMQMKRVSIVVSFLVLLFVFGMIIPVTYASILIGLLLVVLHFRTFYEQREEVNQMIIERLTHIYPRKKCIHNKEDFYLYATNLYLVEGQLIDENQRLLYFLDKNKSQSKKIMV